MSFMPKVQKTLIWDGSNIDSFGRLRVSQPETQFDAQFTYDLQPLLFEQITANGGGGTATVTHDATNRNALMSFSSALTGGKAYMQTFEYFRYQPGKSHLIFITGNFIAAVANVLKFFGYSDGVNGIEFQNNGTVNQFVIYNAGTLGNQTVTQANWNIDTMDGKGRSGLTLDITKTQIVVFDLQALYVGRVQCGFDIGGIIYWVHEFKHSNLQAEPYIQSANLPVRAGMTCTGTVTATMDFQCSVVISEGGTSETHGYSHAIEGTGTAGDGSQAHILSVRPKTTFNSIANRAKFILESVDVVVTGANPVKWELCIGQAISGTTAFNDVNTAYSGWEYNTAGTISGTPAYVIATGYCAASNQVKQSISKQVTSRLPITLDAAGAARILGTISVIATGIGGTSATRATLNWRSIR